LQFSDVSDLAGPPLLERFFLVDPIPTAVAVLLIGLLLFEILRRKQRERAATIAFVVGAVLGAAILMLGFGVDTPYEQARRTTERFVDAGVAGDRDVLEDMLAGDFELRETGGGASRDADWLLDHVEDVGGVVTSNQRVWRGGLVIGPQAIQTRMTMRTEVDFRGVTDRFASTWDFFWRRDAGGRWWLERMEPVSINGQKPWPGWSDQAPVAIPR
jgi:hypothetical protein